MGTGNPWGHQTPVTLNGAHAHTHTHMHKHALTHAHTHACRCACMLVWVCTDAPQLCRSAAPTAALPSTAALRTPCQAAGDRGVLGRQLQHWLQEQCGMAATSTACVEVVPAGVQGFGLRCTRPVKVSSCWGVHLFLDSHYTPKRCQGVRA